MHLNDYRHSGAELRAETGKACQLLKLDIATEREEQLFLVEAAVVSSISHFVFDRNMRDGRNFIKSTENIKRVHTCTNT